MTASRLFDHGRRGDIGPRDPGAGRVDEARIRIGPVALTERPAERPEGFQLSRAWASIAATIEQRRTYARATVRTDAATHEGLRRQFGTGVLASKKISGSGFEVQIGSNSPELLAAQLAGWGKQIEVRGPEEIRRHLARIGAELVATYRGSTAGRGGNASK